MTGGVGVDGVVSCRSTVYGPRVNVFAAQQAG